MYYLIQVTVYTGLMLLLYLLLLRNRSMHSFNRMYLLLTAVLPVLLPLIKLPQSFRPATETGFFTTDLAEVTVGGASQVSTGLPVWLIALVAVYLLVAVAMLIVKAVSFIKLRRLIAASTHERKNGYTILKDTGFGPGSFGRYIFLPSVSVDDTIIEHEQVHIQLRHSYDLLFLNIMQALLWPNLFIHFIKNELVQVHEFQADAAVGMEQDGYAQLLLNSVFDSPRFQLAHSFIDHPIKRRIMMLYKNNTPKRLRSAIAALSAIVLLGGIVTMQSCEQKKAQDLPEPIADYTKLSQHPEPGYNLAEELGSKVKYPADAKEKGIEGRIVVKFILDENGKITKPEIINKEYDLSLGKAALDAVKAMPDWQQPAEQNGTRVRVIYNLPITFQLPKEKDVSKMETIEQDKPFVARMDRNASPVDKEKAKEARHLMKEYNEQK